MVGLCLICLCFAVCVCSAMVLVERGDLYGGFVCVDGGRVIHHDNYRHCLEWLPDEAWTSPVIGR